MKAREERKESNGNRKEGRRTEVGWVILFIKEESVILSLWKPIIHRLS